MKSITDHIVRLGIIISFLMIPLSTYAGISVKREINWQEFMKSQDMVWETLPEYWYESAYLGNGMLGLMVYKEPGENYIRLETGNCAVHDHRSTDALWGIPRLLTGHFALHPKGKIITGTMRLDLWNAEATTDITTSEGIIHLKSFVHANEMIIVNQVTTEGNEQDFRWEWIPACPQSPRYTVAKTKGSWIKIPDNYILNPNPEIAGTANDGISVQRLQAGGETAVGWKENRSPKGERTLYINIVHSYPESNAHKYCRQELNRSIKNGYKKLQSTHRQWWHNYYPSSFLTLPDGVKENFYWIQMYKLASATRGDRALIDCTGPWLTVTPWPNAWWNLNVQLTYWPLNASNRIELAGSLENALYGNIDQLRKNVNKLYQHDSFGIGRASNLECVTGTIGIPGVHKNAEIGLLTWACHNLWLIYRHKMDDKLLHDKLFPLLKGAVNYYLHFLQKGTDGKLHLPMTYSPEYGSAEDCNFDLALLRWGCQTLLQSAKRLNINDPLIPEWKKVLHNLTPYPTDENGLMIGKNTPYAFSHRHYSHLLSIYPLYLINKDEPENIGLIKKSLDFWQSKTSALQGYSQTGASSICAAIGEGNEALTHLDKLFDQFLSVNTLYKEAGPVIETPLSGAQSIHDMLLQSWGGKIRIFPAVPNTWRDIAYDKFLAEGAFEVSASRKDGKTEFLQIKSLAGEPCIIVTDISNPIFKGSRSLAVKHLQKNTYQIDLRKGEQVIVYPQGSTSNFTIRPIKNTRIHCFGKKINKI